MAQFMFYENLVPLNRDQHKNLRIKTADAVFGHVKDINAAPLAVIEFAEAAHEYAILFAGPDKESAAPVALLGLADNANAYVDDSGNWAEGYRPAFVRMYPFVLVNHGENDHAVCIDENYAGLNEEEGEALFNEDGTESEAMQRAIEFLTKFHGEMRRTEAFTKELIDLDLLVERAVRVRRPSGEMVNLKGLYVIDEAKLHQLDDEAVLRLHKTGMTACIYSHLLSLRNLGRLSARSPAA